MFCGLQPHRERAKQCINDAAGGLTRRKDLIEPRDGYFTSPQEVRSSAPSRVGSFIRACAPADLNNEPSFSALAPEGGLFVEETFCIPPPSLPSSLIRSRNPFADPDGASSRARRALPECPSRPHIIAIIMIPLHLSDDDDDDGRGPRRRSYVCFSEGRIDNACGWSGCRRRRRRSREAENKRQYCKRLSRLPRSPPSPPPPFLCLS